MINECQISFIMCDQNNFSNLFITSACISGPIIEGIEIGACVNDEFNNNQMKEHKLDKMRFDIAYDIEERKDDYSDEELNSIYCNPELIEAEDRFYDNIFRERMHSYWSSLMEQEDYEDYCRQMEREEEEREAFLREEEEEAINYERFVGIVSRRL